jgi:IgGFc binding protein/Secretion system C-terminal sorting domain
MKTFFLFLAILLLPILSFSQEKEVKSSNILGSTGYGYYYYGTFHPGPGSSDEPDLIYIFSQLKTTVTVTVSSKEFEQEQKTIPNEFIVFEIPKNISRPYSKKVNEKPNPDSVYKASAIRIYAGDPVVAYCVSGGSAGSFLARAVPNLGKEYIISSSPDPGNNESPDGEFFTSYASCVAPYDKTKVRFTAGGPSFSETSSGMKVGENITFALSQGDVLMMGSLGKGSDLSGSKFTANKNIACFSGSYCAHVPENTGECEYTIKQELPTYTWGTIYYVAPIAGRKRASMLKIYAKNDSTKIYRDSEFIGELLHGGGGKPGEAYLEMRASDDSDDPKPVVISADKPIMVVQYNPGSNDDGVQSKPFKLNISPLEQYETGVITKSMNNCKNNFINLIYYESETGEFSQDFQIRKIEDGKLKPWEKMNDLYPGAGIEFAEVYGEKKYFARTIEIPEGIYQLRKGKPFAAYAYGYDENGAYAHTLGIQLGVLEKPDTVAPICKPYIDDFGVVRDGRRNGNTIIEVKDMPDDEEHRSNMASVIALPYPESYNFYFSKENFIPGESREVYWWANVIDLRDTARLIMIFRDRRGNALMDTLMYVPDEDRIQIVVDDYSFKEIFVEEQSDFYDVKIKNLDTISHEIIGFTPPKLRRYDDGPIFTYTNLDEIFADEKTLTLDSGETYSFKVSMFADKNLPLLDSIIFYSSDAKGDLVCQLFADKSTDVEELNDRSISVYPNPCKGIINLEAQTPDMLITGFVVRDMKGKTIVSENGLRIKSKQLTLDNLPNNTYLICISTTIGIINKKIILNK